MNKINISSKEYNWLSDLPKRTGLFNLIYNNDNLFTLIHSLHERQNVSWPEIARLLSKKTKRKFSFSYVRDAFNKRKNELIKRDGEILIYSLGDGDYHVGDMAHLPGPSEEHLATLKEFDAIGREPLEIKKTPLSNERVLEIFDEVAREHAEAKKNEEDEFHFDMLDDIEKEPEHDEDGFNFNEEVVRGKPEECIEDITNDNIRTLDEISENIKRIARECLDKRDNAEKTSDELDLDDLYDPVEELLYKTNKVMDTIQWMRQPVPVIIAGIIGLGAGILVSGLFRRKH